MAVRVAVIGAGVMGADHARLVAQHVPGATLRTVCDADAARARAVAEQTGAADVATDPMAVIADPTVDAVLIASPDNTHAALTLACIAAGKPVLCEKPLAPTPEECLGIIAAETKRGKRLVQVGFMRRFDPAYVEMKATLAAGRIGRALMLHNIHRNVAAPAWFTSDMAITNSAPHEFDIARFILDTDIVSIRAMSPWPADPSGKLPPVFMVMETAARQLVSIEVTLNASYGYDVRGELVGETGSVILRAPAASGINSNGAHSTAYPGDWRPRFADAYRLQNHAWVTSIHSGQPAGANAWDGYQAQLVAGAGVRSLATGEAVRVESAARPALHA